jgi:hypothetical protein
VQATIGYEWALVSGGVPGVAAPGGCRTGSTDPRANAAMQNGIGLWLLSRKPVDQENTRIMLKVARDLGAPRG